MKVDSVEYTPDASVTVGFHYGEWFMDVIYVEDQKTHFIPEDWDTNCSFFVDSRMIDLGCERNLSIDT
jgi:hypothetical protein